MGLIYDWSFNNTLVDNVQGVLLNYSSPKTNPSLKNRPNFTENGIYLNRDYLTAPPGVYFNNAFSISVWVKLKSFIDKSRVLDFAGIQNGQDNVVLALTNISTYFPYGVLFINSDRYDLEGRMLLQLNKWTHITWSHNGTYSQFYLNATLTNSASFPGPRNVTRTSNYICETNYGAPYSNVILKNLRIFNRALNSTEVLQNMNLLF